MSLNKTCLDYNIMIIDAQLSNLHHLVIEEGRTHPISIETSLPEYLEATTIAHVVTLNEYKLLANSSNSVCRMGLNDVLSFSETQLSDLDPAEGENYGNLYYRSNLL